MPESLPTAIAVLRDRMETLVNEELRPLEARLSDDPRAPVPPEIAQQVRERSRDAGMWSLTQPVEFLMVLEVDRDGKIRLSRRAAVEDQKNAT